MSDRFSPTESRLEGPVNGKLSINIQKNKKYTYGNQKRNKQNKQQIKNSQCNSEFIKVNKPKIEN